MGFGIYDEDMMVLLGYIYGYAVIHCYGLCCLTSSLIKGKHIIRKMLDREIVLESATRCCLYRSARSAISLHTEM